jgi:hypothetical protein
MECSLASRFAVTAARHMRAGSRSDEVFNRYGGLDSLSKGSIGVINYVYSFRTNNDGSEEGIGGCGAAITPVLNVLEMAGTKKGETRRSRLSVLNIAKR